VWGAAASDEERYNVADFADGSEARIAALEAWVQSWTSEMQTAYDGWSSQTNLTDSYELCKFYFLLLMLDELEISFPSSGVPVDPIDKSIAELKVFDQIAAVPARMFAAWRLADFDAEGKKAIPALTEATRDPADQVRAWAHAALASITGDVEPHRKSIHEILKKTSAKEIELGFQKSALEALDKTAVQKAISRLTGAAVVNDLEEIKKLVKRVDVNLLDHNDQTAIGYAVGNSHPDAVRLLLEAGANPNQRDRNKDMTLLHSAAYRRRGDVMIAMLLRHGADPNLRDASGRTPLDIANESRRPKNAALLQAAMQAK
jgi:hypothetical protein